MKKIVGILGMAAVLSSAMFAADPTPNFVMSEFTGSAGFGWKADFADTDNVKMGMFNDASANLKFGFVTAGDKTTAQKDGIWGELKIKLADPIEWDTGSPKMVEPVVDTAKIHFKDGDFSIALNIAKPSIKMDGYSVTAAVPASSYSMTIKDYQDQSVLAANAAARAEFGKEFEGDGKLNKAYQALVAKGDGWKTAAEAYNGACNALKLAKEASDYTDKVNAVGDDTKGAVQALALAKKDMQTAKENLDKEAAKAKPDAATLKGLENTYLESVDDVAAAEKVLADAKKTLADYEKTTIAPLQANVDAALASAYLKDYAKLLADLAAIKDPAKADKTFTSPANGLGALGDEKDLTAGFGIEVAMKDKFSANFKLMDNGNTKSIKDKKFGMYIDAALDPAVVKGLNAKVATTMNFDSGYVGLRANADYKYGIKDTAMYVKPMVGYDMKIAKKDADPEHALTTGVLFGWGAADTEVEMDFFGKVKFNEGVSVTVTPIFGKLEWVNSIDLTKESTPVLFSFGLYDQSLFKLLKLEEKVGTLKTAFGYDAVFAKIAEQSFSGHVITFAMSYDKDFTKFYVNAHGGLSGAFMVIEDETEDFKPLYKAGFKVGTKAIIDNTDVYLGYELEGDAHKDKLTKNEVVVGTTISF